MSPKPDSKIFQLFHHVILLTLVVPILFFLLDSAAYSQGKPRVVKKGGMYKKGTFRPITPLQERIKSERDFRKALLGGATDPNLFIIEMSTTETGTGYKEKYEYRLPDNYDPYGAPHPVVVSWHGYGQSFHSVYVDSKVDEECDDRNWVFMSFRGFNQAHFAHPIAQKHCSAALWHLINVENINIDTNRIYMAGFSMGALGAVSYASRHMSPKYVANISAGDYPSYPVAGLILVSPVLDLSYIYANGLTAKPWLNFLFGYDAGGGGSSNSVALRFALKQVSGIYLEGTSYDIEESMGQNLRYQIPVYITYGANDLKVQYCPLHTLQFTDLLDDIGAVHQERVWITGTEQYAHHWSLLDTLVKGAFDFIEPYSLDDQQTESLELLADRNEKFYWSEAIRSEPYQFARITCDVDPLQNRLTIDKADNMTTLRILADGPSLKDDQDMIIDYNYPLTETNQVIELHPMSSPPLSVYWTFGLPMGYPYSFYAYNLADQLLSVTFFPPGGYTIFLDLN